MDKKIIDNLLLGDKNEVIKESSIPNQQNFLKSILDLSSPQKTHIFTKKHTNYYKD